MYTRDPRYIARKAELYLKQTGIADTSFWGPECEFYIFDSVRFDQNQHEGYYHLDAIEGVWNSGRERELGGEPNLGYKPRYKEGYFPLPPMDHYQDLRSEMVLNLEKVGLSIEVHHHEVGTAGQAEIDMRYGTLLATADNVMKYKYVVKNTARHAGKTVTFMPKPLFQDNGSGMHTHQSLWKDDDNLFWDEVGYAGISDTARWYIGGLIAQGPPLLAFTNPTTNSYRRWSRATRPRSTWCTRSGTGAPASGSRSTSRTPAPSGWSSVTRPLVQPVPGVRGDAHGGTRRREEKIEPPEPMDKDLYDLPPEEKASVKQVPGSLEQVLDSLEADHQWLLEGGVFTQDVIDTWIEYKRVHELDAVRLRPHPYEFALYYDL